MKKKQHKKKHSQLIHKFYNFGGFLVVLAFIIGFLFSIARLHIVWQEKGFSEVLVPEKEVKEEVVTEKVKKHKEKKINLLFLGDIMLGRGVLSKIKANEVNYSFPFEYVSETFTEYDYVFGNLEGPISDRGALVGSRYSFRFPEEVAGFLSRAGIDGVSLANNHIWDYGSIALCDTVDALIKEGVDSVGAGCTEALANASLEIDISGISVLIMSFTNLYPEGLTARGNGAGISNLEIDLISQKISEFKERVPDGFVIVQMHWGDEYEERSHVREREIAHGLVDVGVDIIIGHHPHVTQEIEQYNKGLIFYSLGNFIFDQYFSEETMRGFAVDIELSLDPKRVGFYLLPYVINSNYQPIFLGR